MSAYRLTKRALDDLVSIGRFTAKEWGVVQRDYYLKQLDNCFSRLAENPELGVVCDFILEGYRKFPQGSHLIFLQDGFGRCCRDYQGLT